MSDLHNHHLYLKYLYYLLYEYLFDFEINLNWRYFALYQNP